MIIPRYGEPVERKVWHAHTHPKKATYDDLYSLPDNVTGEIIEGKLHPFPRPRSRHRRMMSGLNLRIGAAYDFGDSGGPGGWIILIEPEVKLGENLVGPGLVGWKVERLPELPEENWISIVPDWVCEVLSPGSLRLDRTRKMDIYAKHGVPFLRFVDPIAKLLETFRL